jgi:hypothetical protein
MAEGFGVTMADLPQAADTFRAEGQTFEAIMPDSGPATVDGGSSEFDGALSEVLGAIGGLHTQLGGIIGQHADKLQATYREYRDAEDAIVRETEAIATPSRLEGTSGG